MRQNRLQFIRRDLTSEGLGLSGNSSFSFPPLESCSAVLQRLKPLLGSSPPSSGPGSLGIYTGKRGHTSLSPSNRMPSLTACFWLWWQPGVWQSQGRGVLQSHPPWNNEPLCRTALPQDNASVRGESPGEAPRGTPAEWGWRWLWLMLLLFIYSFLLVGDLFYLAKGQDFNGLREEDVRKRLGVKLLQLNNNL